jgi:hypothetical protein
MSVQPQPLLGVGCTSRPPQDSFGPVAQADSAADAMFVDVIT